MRYLKTLLSALIFSISSLSGADEIRIGTTLSLSGPYANYGRNALNGITMAIEEANARGPHTFKLYVEDFGTLDLKRAASSIRKLVNVDKIQIYLPLIVEDSEVTVPFTTKIPIFSMVVGCGARKCGTVLGRYNTRAPASHDVVIQKLALHAHQRGVQRTCIIAAQSTYFEQYGRYIEELARADGQSVIFEPVPLSNSEDYRDIATRFSHGQCDAVYSWIPMGSIGNFFRRLNEAGYRGLQFGIVETDDPVVLKSAGKAAEGVIFARFSVGSEEFRQKWDKRFGSLPLRPAIPAYDGVRYLFAVVNEVGTSAEKIRERISKIKNVEATNGFLTFTDDGERLGESVELMKISNGKAEPL